MNAKNKILEPIKRSIIIILITFFTILISFTYLQYRSGQKTIEDKLVINLFGKQRMYTQLMSKDVNRIYVLIQQQAITQENQNKETAGEELQELKENLRQTREKFEETLSSMHQDTLIINEERIHIKKPVKSGAATLRRLDELWKEFAASIDALGNASQINQETAQAARFVNDNNMELLELCDSMLEYILQESIRSSQVTQDLIYGLIVFSSLIVVVTLLHLVKYIIVPFSQLYKGIEQIGLDKNPGKSGYLTRKNIVPITTEINQMFQNINNLISLIENINNKTSFTETLNFINRKFSSFIPYTYIGIALIDEDKKRLTASYGVTNDMISDLPEKLLGKSWLISDTSLGALLHSGEARIINDLEEYTQRRPFRAYNKIILDAGIRASITLPLIVSNEPVGIIFFSSMQKGVYKAEHLNFLRTLANSIAISLNQKILINDLVYSGVLALAKLSEARDEDTGDHLERMKIYSRLIAELLHAKHLFRNEITGDYIEMIERFSPLHDIGKVGIRDGILLKPGKLTKEEFEEMKRHTTYGADVLRAAEENMKKGRGLFVMGIEIAEGHHEKWDGSGYPYGKKENEIPLSARIVAVADVFDALTSRRPYKEPFSFESSMQIIGAGRGKHFDPDIVDVFVENKKKIMELYQSFQNQLDISAS